MEEKIPEMSLAPKNLGECRPSDAECLQSFDINIKFLSRGCIVGVGCKQIAFESVENAMSAINAYVANPYEEKQRWKKNL